MFKKILFTSIICLITNVFMAQTPKEYIKKYSYLAKEVGNQFGVPPSILLAYGMYCTNAGSSTNEFTKINNHFKLKCYSAHCKKGHCTCIQTKISHKDFFTKYRLVRTSYENFAKITQYRKGNYIGYRQISNSLKYTLEDITPEKLIGIIERYELFSLDL